MTIFRATWTRRLDEAFFLLLFTGLLIATIVAAVQTKSWIMILFCLLWVVMLGGCLFVILTSVCEIWIQPNSLYLRSLLFEKTLQDSEIDSIQGTVAWKSSTVGIVSRGKKRFTLYLKSYENANEVQSEIDMWWSLAKAKQPQPAQPESRTFGTKSFSSILLGFTTFLSLFLIGAPLTDPKMLTTLWISAPLVGLLYLLGIWGIFSFVRVEPEGLIVRRFSAVKRIPWESITRLTLSNSSSKGSVNENMTIYFSQGKTYINGIYDDFPLLRDMIISHTPPTVIVDHRQRI